MFVYPTERKKTFQAPKRVNAAASKKTPAKIKPGPEKSTASLDVGLLFILLTLLVPSTFRQTVTVMLRSLQSEVKQHIDCMMHTSD